MNLIDKIWKKLLLTSKKQEVDNEIKKVLFITMQFGLGDGVRITNFIESLAEKYELDTLGNRNQKIINRYNPKIKKIFEYKCKKNNKVNKSILTNLNLIFKLKKNRYDLVIDASSSASSFNLIFLRFINAKRIYGFNHVNNRYHLKNITLYNKLFDNMEELMDCLNLNEHNRIIHLPLDKVDEKIKNQKYEILFNVEGSNKFIPDNKIIEILKLFDTYISKNIKIISVNRRDKIKKILKVNKFKNIELLPETSFHDVIYIVKNAEILISPDTSLIHVASIYDKKILGIYPNMEGFVEAWGPESSIYEIVTPKEKTDNFNYLDKIDSKVLLESLKNLIN